MNTFDEKKRREELNELLCQLLSMRNNDNYRVLDKIISQEKLMIEQAKKEAREEFAERLGELYDIKAYGDWTIEKVNLSIRINGLLKEYEEGIV
jgi:hypothetical protein